MLSWFKPGISSISIFMKFFLPLILGSILLTWGNSESTPIDPPASIVPIYVLLLALAVSKPEVELRIRGTLSEFSAKMLLSQIASSMFELGLFVFAFWLNSILSTIG